MRSFIGGLLGLCLGLTLLPQDASARTDPRSSAHNTTASRSAVAARPTSGRTAAARPTATRATGAVAANPRQAAAPNRATSATTSRTAERRGSARQAAAVPYSRQAAASAPRGLRQTAMASCTTRNGRRTCTPGATRTATSSWTGGLAPAAMSQAGCPDGTIATMALGHNDITRCVPL